MEQGFSHGLRIETPSSFEALPMQLVGAMKGIRMMGNTLGLEVLEDGGEDAEGDWDFGAAEEGVGQEDAQEVAELQKKVVSSKYVVSPSIVDPTADLESPLDFIDYAAELDDDKPLDTPPTPSISRSTSGSLKLAATPQTSQPSSASSFFRPFVSAASLFDSTSTECVFPPFASPSPTC